MGGNDADTERLDEIHNFVFVPWVLEKAVIVLAANYFAMAADLEIEPDEAIALERCD